LGDQGSPPAIVSVSSDGVAATPADERIRTRLSGDELLAELFESMHELQFASDAVAGSDFCLSVAMATIPSEAAVAYLYDMGRREFVVASTSGTRVDKFRDRRYADHDPLLSHAMRESGALIVDNTGDGKTALPERYAELGKVRSLVIAGAKLNRRFLGAIELIDPLDGLPFTSTEGNALSYIAEQFGEFVASRGIAPESAHSLPSRKRK
jgi:GAF domain-containing protein